MAAVTDFTVRLMVRTGVEVRRHNYEELCEYALGPAGFYVASSCMFLFAYGAMVRARCPDPPTARA